jgi:hypothetical protein
MSSMSSSTSSQKRRLNSDGQTRNESLDRSIAKEKRRVVRLDKGVPFQDGSGEFPTTPIWQLLVEKTTFISKKYLENCDKQGVGWESRCQTEKTTGVG